MDFPAIIFSMNVVGKMLAVGFSGLLLGGFAMVGLQTCVTNPYLEELREKSAEGKADQIHMIFEGEWESLGRSVSDWAVWNDSFDFLRGEKDGFIEDNLDAATFRSLEINRLFFLDRGGNVVWGALYDLDTDKLIPVLSVGAYRSMIFFYEGFDADRMDGYFLSPDGPEILSIRSVQNTRGLVMPSPGYVLMTKKIDASFLLSAGKRAGLRLELRKRDESLPPGIRYLIEKNSVEKGSSFTLRVPMTDIRGSLAFEIDALMTDELVQAGHRATLFMAAGNLGVLAVMILFILIFMRLNLVQPLVALASLTKRVSAEKDYSLRSGLRRADELGVLSEGIDLLISTAQTHTATLQRLANTDGLTGLSNRRVFNQALENAWLVCAREKKPLGLVLGDIDHFKRYNDLYGHQRGDACLKVVAQVIQDVATRPGDVKARYGGEEFALILPNTERSGVAKIAEDVRVGIESLAVPHADNEGEIVTMSLGYGVEVPDQTSTVEGFLALVDQALYAAKNAGRNRVASASGGQ